VVKVFCAAIWQKRTILDGLLAPIIVDVVGSWFGAEQQVIADILFDEAVSIMAANHGVGEINVFDHGLEFSAVLLGKLAAEDHGDFVGLTDGSIGVEQPFSQSVQGRAPAEDEVIAEFGLGKE
jgi:hypothetical protein